MTSFSMLLVVCSLIIVVLSCLQIAAMLLTMLPRDLNISGSLTLFVISSSDSLQVHYPFLQEQLLSDI